DFLINVKQGHCEKFAGALALSLRGIGIPTRVIHGYRGVEEEGEGEYVVRLDQAHSWVQVLVQEDGQWYWLTLDPTPGFGDEVNPLATWLVWFMSLDAEQLWRRFVLNYNGEVQSSAMHYLWQGIWQSGLARNLLWQMPAGFAGFVMLLGAWRARGRLWAVLRLPARSQAASMSPR